MLGYPAPLIFLHGNVGTGADWAPVLDALPDSMKEAATTPILWTEVCASYEAWVSSFCDSIAGEQVRPLLVGYSLGGRLALHALTARPDCFSGAVILSAHTGLPDIRERDARLERDRYWAAQAEADWGDFLTHWMAQSVFDGGSDLEDREALIIWQKQIARAFDVWSLGRQDDLLPKLRVLSLPMLWVTGQRDVRFTEIAAKACQEMNDSKHTIVEGAGHRVPWDQPAVTAALISQFSLEVAGRQ